MSFSYLTGDVLPSPAGLFVRLQRAGLPTDSPSHMASGAPFDVATVRWSPPTTDSDACESPLELLPHPKAGDTFWRPAIGCKQTTPTRHRNGSRDGLQRCACERGSNSFLLAQRNRNLVYGAYLARARGSVAFVELVL